MKIIDSFKLRAWNKNKKAMGAVFSLTMWADGCHSVAVFTKKGKTYSEYPKCEKNDDISVDTWDKDYVLMRCTSLQDKNGVLIY